MASRSRFYVDTPPPREPKQRHSMFVTHSELVQTQDLSSNSSSATLPSTAGSVDRLTGLDEKKSSRFFTLKPKTSFSLRPFFRSTSSLASLSPGKRRKAILERRDSGVQTEESRPEFGEVGVQTLNASTVDVPVQTCLEAWEEGDSYGHRRLAYASTRASPFWCRPAGSSSALSNSLLSKNVPKDPLASPKLIKYAVPGVSEKTALHHQSTVTPVDVNSCQPVSPPSHSISSSSTSVPVKYFSAKELSGNAISLSVSTECQTVNEPQNVPSNESNQNSNYVPLNRNIGVKEKRENICESEASVPQGYTVLDTQTPEVSNELKLSISPSIELPLSALKAEGTDSPSRRHKTVHFELSEPEPSKKLSNDFSKPRDIDKDFEALLRDLNILTEDESDLHISLNSVSLEKSHPSNLISPKLKSALDALREDFLAPIPENLNECNENDPTVDKLNSSEYVSEVNKTETEIADLTPVTSKRPFTRSISEYENQNEWELNTGPKLDNTGDVNKDSKTGIKVESVSVDFSLAASKETPTRSVSDFKNQNECKVNTEPKLDNSCDVNKDSKSNGKVESVSAGFSPEASKETLTRSDSEYEYQSAVEINKTDSVAPTSLSIFTSSNSGSNPETDSLEGNVYDNVIKEENPVKTAPLPILPSFFETSSHAHNLETKGIVEYGNLNSSEVTSDNQPSSTMPLESEFDRNRLSRSSSRSSVKSNSKSGLDSFREPVSRFDSCENLDQLEEEIIRSLYSPDEGKLEDNIMKNIELPPSESFQNSGTTATHMRRVILDQLLNGKNVEDIVPNYPLYQRAHSVPETGSKYKSPTKYTAVLTKMCHDDNENTFVNSTENNLDSSSLNSSNFRPIIDLSEQKENSCVSDPKSTSTNNTDSPKRASSVFLFPEDNNPNGNVEKSTLEISTAGQQNKSSILEVRRSSWTPQTTADSTSSNIDGKNSPAKEKTPENKSGQCDFTNCLKPSKIQNSTFLAKINARSMSPCNFSPVPSVYNTSPVNNGCPPKRNNSSPKPPEAAGECDFASCLKPSQVQNSLFTAELSEITANKSTNSLRVGSPLTVRTCSPLPVRSSSSDTPSTPISVVEKSNPEEDSTEPVKHKSEFLITLQTTAKHSSDADIKLGTSPNAGNTGINPSDVLQFDQNINKKSESNERQKIDSIVPPPPPPPPPSSTPKSAVGTKDAINSSFESMIQDQKSNLTAVQSPIDERCVTPKTPIMIELEQKLQSKNDSQRRNSNDRIADECSTSIVEDGEITNAGRSEIRLNGSPNNVSNGNQNGNIGILSTQREFDSSSPNDKNDRNSYGTTKLAFSPNTVITDEPPPPGAVLLDKKVTVDGDKVHTDKFYAIPVKEVLKEKTSTTKFIPAPPKYEGIGPTEEGIPIGLRNSVKKENMHNWYKTMFKSLHKADSSNDDSQEYIIGYTSEPETSKKDMLLRKKSSTLDNRMKHDINSNFSKQNYPASVKSSIEVYNVRPRLIEDYEPGHSSVTDDTVTTSRRYLPSVNTVKPSYEFKNGYESDSNITKKRDQPDALSAEQQKMWYREIQKGGEIPQFGLGKSAPEKPIEPAIGPLPPPPLNYNGQPSCQQAIRPLTLPANYSNQNGNGYCQQMNGAYEMQMRHAIHSEMQHRRSPSSNQLSPPIRTMMKSPSRSPDMKIPAQALFDFKAESPKEIPLKKGDTVLILRQLDKNWYEGEHKGVVGIFPISYVEIIPPEYASTPVKVKTEGLGRALYDFVAQTSIELTVRKGDTITLLRRVDGNWFEGIFNTKKGIVPISYVQVLQEPIDKSMGSPSQKSCTISPSSLESKEKIQKPNSISPSAYSSSSISPLPVNQERRKLLSKKGSNLIEPVMYRALYSYSPQNSDELELQEGDTVYVVEMCDDGWYVGTSVQNGVFGIFPGNYVEKAC